MPALSTAAAKVTLLGTFGGGEEWNTGFWVESPWGASTPDPATLNEFAQDVLDLWGGVWATSLDTYAGNATKPTGVRVNFYPAGSLVSTGTGEATAEIAPGTQTVGHPFQVGIVCSLRTVLATRRGRGRMYLPLNAVPVSMASGQYGGDAAVVAAAMQAFLNGVNALTIGVEPVDVVVASFAAGSAGKVTSIQVNTIPDIQRRRANELTPSSVNSLPIT